MKLYETLWSFFASVKLAIFTLCSLAATSIIGTIIPQGKPYAFYAGEYGAKTAQFIHILDIDGMYYSWWFLGLLGVLSANLIICSLDRLPAVLRIVTADNMAMVPERMQKMHFSRTWQFPQQHLDEADIPAILGQAGWKTGRRLADQDELYFSQKHPWSRLGVYVVHLSILVIFVGAIIGHFLGFKGSVMIPELQSTEVAYAAGDSSPIPLGFTVRCDSFTIDFYDNGMPRDYRSGLTILDRDQVLQHKMIEVNDPLTYRGITFYQASYEPSRDFVLTVTDKASGEKKQFVAPFQQPIVWEEHHLQLGVINAEAMGQRVVREKLWFKAGDGQPTTFWLADNTSASFAGDGRQYTISAKQMYATGLQVAKDPGVWLVYLGCGLMLAGLFMAFFLTHQRIWLYRHVDAAGTTIHLSGSTNKNRAAFARVFARLEALVDQALSG